MTSTTLLRREASSLQLVARDETRPTGRNRRILVPRYGGPDAMTVIEEPLPEPGHDQEAAGWTQRVCRGKPQ